MRNSYSQKKIIISFLMYVAFAVAFGLMLVSLIWHQAHLKPDRIPGVFVQEELNVGWSIGEVPDPANTFTIPADIQVEQGEDFTISRRLPVDGNFSHLMLWNKGQDVCIRLDGVEIYNYNVSDIETIGKDRPYLYLLVQLPDDWQNKVISVSYKSVHPADLGKIGEIAIGEKTSLLFSVIKVFQYEVIAAIVLIFIALEMMAQSIFLRITARTQNSMLSLGASILVAAFWILSDSRLRQFVFENVSSIRNAAFFSVMILPGVMSLYVNHIQRRRYENIYRFFQIIILINIVVQFVLNRLDIMGLSEMSAVSHLLCVVIIGIFLTTKLIDDRKKQGDNYNMAALGLTVFSIGAVLQIVFYRFISLPKFSGMFVVVGLIGMTVFCTGQNFKELGFVHRSKESAENAALSLTDDAMVSIARTVDAKDLYTSGHSHRVASYAREIAKRLGKDKEFQDRIYYIGLLHDVGKIGIPDSIINKTDKLTNEEYDKVKAHVVIGSEIIERISAIPDLYDGVRHHHERYDGGGYPDGLAGKNIPLVARIIAVSDSYDAMTSNRSYRDSLSQDAVKREIEQGRGTQFDPEIADIMLQMISEDESYILRENGGTDSEFAESIKISDEEKQKRLDALKRTVNDYNKEPFDTTEEPVIGWRSLPRLDLQEGASEKLLNVILYGGVKPEIYREIHDKEMTETNIRFVKYFSIAASICIGLMLCIGRFDISLGRNSSLYIAGTSLSLMIYFIAKWLSKRWPQGIYYVIYLSVAVFFGYGILLGTMTRPELPTVTFMVMLIFVPLLFVDSPARMGLSIILADVVFIIICLKMKTGDILATDIADAIVFGILSLLSDTVMMVFKIRGFALEREMERQSYMDRLTGVKNRNSFESELLRYPERIGQRLYCVYADVNGLHELNNTMGHDKGDLMLKIVAGEFRDVFGKEDTYRIGGDEFVAFGIDIDNMELVSRLYVFNEKIKRSGYHVSIGFDSMELKDIDMKKLISSAEKKMYEEKRKYYSEQGNDRRKR